MTSDVAMLLGLHFGGDGQGGQVRIGVTAQDVESSADPLYARYLGKSAVFTVLGQVPGVGRVELFPSSLPAAGDGGARRLFGEDHLAAGACVSLWGTAPGATVLNGRRQAHFEEPGSEGSYEETVEVGAPELCLLAPHGGGIVPGSSELLAAACLTLEGLGRVPTRWECRGRSRRDTAGWRIAAERLHPESYPGLDHLMSRFVHTAAQPFRYALAIEGLAWHGRGLLIGGSAPRNAKLVLLAALEEWVEPADLLAVHVADDSQGDMRFAGIDGVIPSRTETVQGRHLSNRLASDGLIVQVSSAVLGDPALRLAVGRGLGHGLAQLLRNGSGAVPVLEPVHSGPGTPHR